MLEEIRLLHEILHELRTIRRELRHEPQPVTGGIIRQIGNSMSLLPIAPGNAPQFQVTPTPAGVVTVASQTAWNVTGANGGPSTSGATASINSSDPTGNTVTVSIPASAPLPFNDLLNWVYTNADGSTASATFPLSDSTGTAVDVTGGTIAQIV